MNPEPSNPEPPGPAPLPVSPFVLVDTLTVEHAATALTRLESWLLSGDPAATAACAQACSNGEDDAVAIASLGRHPRRSAAQPGEEVTSWS